MCTVWGDVEARSNKELLTVHGSPKIMPPCSRYTARYAVTNGSHTSPLPSLPFRRAHLNPPHPVNPDPPSASSTLP